MTIASIDTPLVDELLAPIPGENPAGQELDPNSFGSPLVEVQTRRDEAEKNEILKRLERRGQNIDTQGEVITPGKVDWKIVLDSASAILRNQSKDLRAAAWMSEALLRQRSIAGLVDGLAVCHGLCTDFWEHVHPRPTETDGHSIAMSGLVKLFSADSVELLRDLPLADTGTADPRVARVIITFGQQRLASEFDQLDESRQQERRAMGGVSTDEVDAAIAKTDRAQLIELNHHLELAIENLNTLGSLLRNACLPDIDEEPTAPDYVAFRSELESMHKTVSRIVESFGGAESDAPAITEGDGADGNGAVMVAGGAPVMVISGTRLADRDDAFRVISQLADYFEQNEPQSPVHLGLRQIVRWGKMSFPQLMLELLEDEDLVKTLGKRVGFQSESE